MAAPLHINLFGCDVVEAGIARGIYFDPHFRIQILT